MNGPSNKTLTVERWGRRQATTGDRSDYEVVLVSSTQIDGATETGWPPAQQQGD